MVYLINVGLMLFWDIVIPENARGKRKALCVLYCLQWILLSGLRAYTVGADTFAYKIYHFDVTYATPWNRLFSLFSEYLHGGGGIKDPGYAIFEKICQVFIGNHYTMYLLVIACVFTIPMGRWIYKYSENICLSFMIYSALFYSFFAITGHRQTVASALVIFVGYECMKKNKIIPLLLVHLVAFFIHKSSICFIILYFARFIKINKLYWTVSTALIVFSFIFRNQFMTLLGDLMEYESYAEQLEGAGTYTFTFFLLTIYAVAMILYSRIPPNVDFDYSVIAMTLAVIFTPLTFVHPAAMRVVQYFSIFMLILVPKLILAFNKPSRIIANCGCYGVLIGSLLIKLPNYSFVFWS